MTDFNMDGEKRFPENCAAFMESVKEIDPQMAEILYANWEKLLEVVEAGERDTKARTTFNEAIAAALDDLLKNGVETGSE